jgi:hypothetical protein
LKNKEIFLMLKFRDSMDELQDIVIRCAIPGIWSFHKKSRFYRFQAATGAILNWWPNTGTINFQGHDAELFEALFLKHALVGATLSEGVRVCEESAWEAVPGPTQTQGDPEKPQVLPGQKTAGVWLLLLVRAWLRDRSSFSLHLIAAEWLEVAGVRGMWCSVRLVPPVGRMDDRPIISSSRLTKSSPTTSAKREGEDDVPASPHRVPRLR